MKKTTNLYIGSAETDDSQFRITIGIVEKLRESGIQNPGIFRPIIADSPDNDPLLSFAREHFTESTAGEAESYGCTFLQAAKLLAAGKRQDLIKILLERFRLVEDKHDLMIISGSDFFQETTAIELDLNIALANNFRCRYLQLISGQARKTETIVSQAEILQSYLLDCNCDLAGILVTQVNSEQVKSLNEQLNAVSVRCFIAPPVDQSVTDASTGENISAAIPGLILGKSELEEILSTPPRARTTPYIFEYELIRKAKQQPKHIVLPEGEDSRILEAAAFLQQQSIANITLLGNRESIANDSAELNLDLDQVNIINPPESKLLEEFSSQYFELRKHKNITLESATQTLQDPSYFGTMMVHLGYADGMVSGAVNTTLNTIKPSFEIIKTRPECSIVSSAYFMCLENSVLLYADCAVNPNPSSKDLAEIAIVSSQTAQQFGIVPKTALLSYSTGESGKGADVEKVREAARLAQELRPDLAIEGPIQYDAAVDPGVAKAKLPNSEVGGQSTVFVFPDLNTANNVCKAVQRSTNALAVGPVLQGLNKPVNDLSRGCTLGDIINTVAITAIIAQN